MSIFGRRPIGTVAYLGGVPAVLEEFAWSWGEMQAYNYEYLCGPNEYVHRDRAKVSFHAYARNSLVERMMGDWLVQLDADLQFDPDTVARLVHLATVHNVDVLTGVYHARSAPHAPLLYSWNGKGYDVIGGWDPDAEVFEVDGAGGGCLFVRRKVFDKIRVVLDQGPFDILPPWGEDLSFFRRLNDLGVKVYAAPRVTCGHLGVRAVGPESFDRSRVTLGPRVEAGGFAQCPPSSPPR